MRVEFEGDYPINAGRFIPGVELSDELAALPIDRLRLMRGVVIDAKVLAAFYIDPAGRKHAERGANRWQLVQCMFDDPIVLGEDGKWRVESPEEVEGRQRAAAWGPVRAERNALLAASDWTQIEDVPMETMVRRQWRAYRQELRDLPQRYEDPAGMIWPSKPE